ncbi:WD40 repeat-like protein [Peniophora sp. CONT]|nr:WD40 repeat-like protein [Peniophora sp. CONT]
MAESSLDRGPRVQMPAPQYRAKSRFLLEVSMPYPGSGQEEVSSPAYKKDSSSPPDPKPEDSSSSDPVRDCCGSKKGGRRLVVCIDGTSNQFGDKNTNVIELYRLIQKKEGDNQLTYYDSGIGTYARPSSKGLSHYKRVVEHKFDLAFAWNFEHILLGAYRWLSENYRDGDCIFLFGFSRGAYQVRTLSAMIRKVGLIHRGNEAQIPFAYELYADPKSDTASPAGVPEDPDASIPRDSSPAKTFKGTFSREVKVHFVGAWDTVSSIGVVRDHRKLLPETTDGMKHVCFFRHALALDERRVKFLPEYANGGAGPSKSQSETVSGSSPHTKEVWFAGTHSDVGGGNIENKDLNNTRPSLRWMFSEASAAGLHFHPFSRKIGDVDVIQVGTESLTLGWRLLEHLPVRRLTYGDGSADTRWKENLPWILIEFTIWPLWILSFIPWFLWKLLLMFTGAAQVTGAEGQGTAEQQWANDTISWPPHRGRGRVIQDGQKIHTSVWRLKNLDTPSASDTATTSSTSAIRSESSARSETQSKYTPRAYLPIEADFWKKISWKPTASEMDEWKRWREVDFYESVEDLVQQYIKHPAADLDDDAQRTQLAMMRIHANSEEVRKELLNELLRLLKIVKDISVDILCSVVEILTGTKTDVPPLELWLDMLRHLNDAATDDQLQIIRRFMEGLTDGPYNNLLDLFKEYINYEDRVESDDRQKNQLTVMEFYARLADTRRVLIDRLVEHLQLGKSGEDAACTPVNGSIICGIFSVILKRSPPGRSNEALGRYRTVHSQVLRHLGNSANQEDLQVVNQFLLQFTDPVWQVLLGHQGTVESVAFFPDSEHVVSSSLDKTIRVWNTNTGQVVGKPFEGHSHWVRSIAVSPDGAYIASGSHDTTIRIWDAKTGQTVGKPLTGHSKPIRSVAFSPDGERVISGSEDNTLRVWDAKTGETVGAPMTGHKGKVYCVAYSRDGTRVISSSADATIRIWDVTTGQTGTKSVKVPGNPRSVAFSPDGRCFVFSSGPMIALCDAETGALVGDPFKGHTREVNCVAFSRDGKRVVSGSDDCTVRVWDLATKHMVGSPYKGHTNMVWSVAFSSDGQHIVSSSADHTVRVWDVPEQQQQPPSPPQQEPPRSPSPTAQALDTEVALSPEQEPLPPPPPPPIEPPRRLSLERNVQDRDTEDAPSSKPIRANRAGTLR